MRILQATICTIAFALGCTAILHAAPPEVIPVPKPDPGKLTEFRVPVGTLFILAAEPASEWELVDTASGADLRSFDNGKFGAFAAPSAGRYRATITGPDRTRTRVVFVVGDPPPPEPVPPKPPVPPPADPLREKVKAAFDADLAPLASRREQAKALAELYRQISEKVCPDPAVVNPADLLDRAREAAKILVGADALLGVRRVVGEELALILPVDAPLTEDQRKETAGLFRRLAVVLDGF